MACVIESKFVWHSTQFQSTHKTKSKLDLNTVCQLISVSIVAKFWWEKYTCVHRYKRLRLMWHLTRSAHPLSNSHSPWSVDKLCIWRRMKRLDRRRRKLFKSYSMKAIRNAWRRRRRRMTIWQCFDSSFLSQCSIFVLLFSQQKILGPKNKKMGYKRNARHWCWQKCRCNRCNIFAFPALEKSTKSNDFAFKSFSKSIPFPVPHSKWIYAFILECIYIERGQSDTKTNKNGSDITKEINICDSWANARAFALTWSKHNKLKYICFFSQIFSINLQCERHVVGERTRIAHVSDASTKYKIKSYINANVSIPTYFEWKKKYIEMIASNFRVRRPLRLLEFLAFCVQSPESSNKYCVKCILD